jgi:HK97 family phage major capsid protein
MRKALRDAILGHVKAARAIADAAETEGRDLTDDEQAKITASLKQAAEMDAKGKSEDALRKQMTDLGDGLGLIDDGQGNDNTVGIHPGGVVTKAEKRTIGRQFTESAEFKAMLASTPNGQFSEKMRVQSQPFGTKTLITGLADASAGALVQNDFRGMLDPFYARPLTIKDLISPGNTTSDTVEFVRLLSVTNNAAVVAEATTAALPTQDGSTGPLILAAGGGYKPESGMVFERDTETVRTIAHWIPATKRALSDAAQVRTLIDTFLRYGLEEELEDQILMGNGVGENFTGINSTSGIQTQVAPVGPETVLHTLRRARRKVRIGGRATPTAYVMNPIDWENIELMQDANDQFYSQGPFSMMTPRLWGLPVVESEAVTAGTAWVADWRHAVLWDREQASVQVTDSHADFFVRNLVAILAEMRAAFGVLRPAAFVKVTLA